MLEQRGVCPPEEALCGGRTVGAADVEVVHGRKRGEPAIAQAMTPVMMQRQLAVASLHTGTAALEQIGAGPGDLFDPRAVRGRETLQRMIGAPQRVEQRGTHRLHAVSGLGRGAAGGDALEIDGRDELLEDCRFQLRGQREGLDPGGHGGEEERERGEPLHGQALGLHDAFASALGQVGRLGQSLQARPDVGEARRLKIKPKYQITGISEEHIIVSCD